MKHRNARILLILVLLVIIQISSLKISAQPYVGEDDTYIKDVSIGASTEFYWTIYQNSSTLYSISFTVELAKELSYKITPNKFILSDRNPYQIVSLNISIPNFPDKERYNGTIIFSIRELNNTNVEKISKNFEINLIGASYIGEENTLVGGFQNPLPKPFDNPYGALVLNIIIWLIIAIIVYLILKIIITSLVKKTKTKFDDAIIAIIRKPIIIIVILYGIITSIIRLGIQIGLQETILQLFTFFVLGIIIYVFYKIYNELLEEITMRRGGNTSTFSKVLKPIFRIIGVVVIIIGGLIYGLNIIGVQVTAILAGAGIFGLVIAFAAQETLSNFFSGIYLLLDRPFRLGDIILLESGEYCIVENVGMRSTKLYSIFDHELIILPNNTMANQKIINIVKPDTKIRQRIEVGVAYGSDVEKVKTILYDSAANHPNIITSEGQEPIVRFTGFGDSSLDFLLIFTVDDVMNQWKVKSDIITEIDKRFRKEHITIPFPQRTIWFNEVTKNEELAKNTSEIMKKKR
jgi:MscS family membrane protein